MSKLIDNVISKMAGGRNFAGLCGLLAIAGTAIVLIVDYKLLYMPLSIKEYSTFRAALSHSRDDILFYSKLAVAAVPLVLVGIYHFYITLAGANKILARVTAGIFVFAYVNAALYYAFLAYIMTTAQLVVPLKLELPYMIKHLYYIFQMQYYGGIIAGSILFFLSLSFFKGNNYPKWFIYINPLYLIGIFRFILPLGTPPALSGFFMTATFNSVMLFTLILSTILMWKKTPDELIRDNAEASG